MAQLGFGPQVFVTLKSMFLIVTLCCMKSILPRERMMEEASKSRYFCPVLRYEKDKVGERCSGEKEQNL